MINLLIKSLLLVPFIFITSVAAPLQHSHESTNEFTYSMVRDFGPVVPGNILDHDDDAFFQSSAPMVVPKYKIPSNVIYISIDGLSSRVLYELLRKNRLRMIQPILDRGNYRNIGVSGSVNDKSIRFMSMLTGISAQQGLSAPGYSLPKGASIMEQISNADEDVHTAIIYSDAMGEKASNSFLTAFKDRVDYLATYKPRELNQVKAELNRYIRRHGKQRFVLFYNLSSVERAGLRYREGSQAYSDEVVRTFRLIGDMIHMLKKQGVWDETAVFITTPYVFAQNKRQPLFDVDRWIISTEKIRRRGMQYDIAPTIYEHLGLDQEMRSNPNLIGSSLF